jgi:hypothetical protein
MSEKPLDVEVNSTDSDSKHVEKVDPTASSEFLLK